MPYSNCLTYSPFGRKAKTAAVSLIGLFGLLLGQPSIAYDTGDGDSLNRLYWSDFEEARWVENGRFMSELRTMEESRSNWMYVDNAGMAMQISADIAVTEVTNHNSRPRARVGGYFLNDGTWTAGDEGEIFATAELAHNGTQIVGVAKVGQCTNSSCSKSNSLLFDDTSFGNFALAQVVNLSVEWDNAQYLIFNIGGTTKKFDVLAAGITVNPPQRGIAGLSTGVSEVNDRLDEGHIVAAFDNVMYNGAILDQFDAAQLDASRWRGPQFELERRIDNGQILLSQRVVGENWSHRLDVARLEKINYIKTDVTIESIEVHDARPRASIAGVWYNDGSHPNIDGMAGEVLGELRIDADESTGQLRALFGIFRCDDENCDTGTDGPYGQGASWSPQLGKKHTLSVSRKGVQFEFCFDDQCEQVTSPFPASSPARMDFPWKGIRTRIDKADASNEWASIAARFDNVQFSEFPTFTDVSNALQMPLRNDAVLPEAIHIFFADIEKLVGSGVTGGCSVSPPKYCPESLVTRGQMAAFIERALSGHFYPPPQASGNVFDDVSSSTPLANWIELFASDGITKGCSTSPPLYCPNKPVRRSEMAVFLLRALYGSSYMPPPATGTKFGDVAKGDFAADYIEDLAAQGITGGCNAIDFCPNDSVTRGQMAAFLKRTFDL